MDATPEPNIRSEILGLLHWLQGVQTIPLRANLTGFATPHLFVLSFGQVGPFQPYIHTTWPSTYIDAKYTFA